MEQENNILEQEIKVDPLLIEMKTEQSVNVLSEVIKVEPTLIEIVDNDVTERDNNVLLQEIKTQSELTKTKKRRRLGLRKCNICQQLFKTLVDLRKHIFTHSNERPFACIPCKMRFIKRCHLQQHIKLKHKVHEKKGTKQGESNAKHPGNLLQMQCRLCKKILLRKNYKRHMLTHDRVQIYLCAICNYKSREQIIFLEHMQLSHQEIPSLTELKEDLPFTCKTCSQSFAYKICFEKHKCVPKDVQKYNCSYCEYKGTTKESVKTHAKNKHDVDFGLDEILEDFSVDIDQLKARLNLHENEKASRISNEKIDSQNCIFIKEEDADRKGDDVQYKQNSEDTDHIKAEIIEIDDDDEDLDAADSSHLYDVIESTGHVKPDVEIGEQKVSAADYTPKITKTTTNVVYKEEKHYTVISDQGFRAFQCTLCSKILKKRYLAERHILRHTGEYPLSCWFCPFKTRQKDTMHQHLKTQHNLDANPTQGGENGEITANQSEETHYKVVLDGEVRVYQCNFCDRTTKEKYLVERHILTHTGEYPLSCSLCSIKTRQKKSMRLHLKKEHGLIVTFKQIAKDGTLTLDLDPKDESKCRIAIKNGLKVYQCHSCNKVFSKQENLEKHYAVHSEIESFYCPTCNYKTKEKKSFQRHMQRKHKVKVAIEDIHKYVSASQECDDTRLADTEEGPEELQNKDAARYTVLIEGVRKLFKCNVCSEVLTEKCLFNAHFLAHTEKLPYSCTVCGHKAKSKKTIKNHMRRRHKINIKTQDIPGEITHTDTEEEEEEDNDAEEEGEYNSVPETQCKYIEIEEENEKFLKCLLCDKKLKTIKRMKVHFLIHQGNFLYTCSICKYKAVEKNNMKQHMKAKHKMDVSIADIVKDDVIMKDKNNALDNNTPQYSKHSEVVYVKEDMDVDFEQNL